METHPKRRDEHCVSCSLRIDLNIFSEREKDKVSQATKYLGTASNGSSRQCH